MRVLVIQTAFIGDVILATSFVSLIKEYFPEAKVDFLLRAGNETLLKNHPQISKVIVWDKKKNKYLNLLKIALKARKNKYDYAFNIQRFTNSGLFTALCGAKTKVGFKQNPLSFLFNFKIEHKIPYPDQHDFLHEVQRNALLLSAVVDNFKLPKASDIPPRLYPDKNDFNKVQNFVNQEFIILAPSSVWFTKQWPKQRWIDIKNKIHKDYHIYFIGAPDDREYIDSIILETSNCTNLCGKLNLVQSAALMQKAKRVIVNDSAPLHLASAVDAPTTAIFCSTVPDFGYTPLSSQHSVVQAIPKLECMPCGLHGKVSCPEGHFKCANNITDEQVLVNL